MKRLLLILYISLVVCVCINAQDEWGHMYFNDTDSPGRDIKEYYDHGYIILGWDGHYFPSHNWILKTDINGEVLWVKRMGEEGAVAGGVNFDVNLSGDVFIAGAYSGYDTSLDPYVYKINACGEKEWCWVYQTGNHYDSGSRIVATPDGGCAAILKYIDHRPDTNRIALARFSAEGELLWINHYEGTDSLVHSEDEAFLRYIEGSGFLISGACYFEDIPPPHYWWLHPYYIKTDLEGNMQWESTLLNHIPDEGGEGFASLVNSRGDYYYSSIRHHYRDQGWVPALIKMDTLGNFEYVQDLAEGVYQYLQFYRIEWVNDSIIAGTADFANEESNTCTQAILVDTLGNIIKQKCLLEQGGYSAWMDKTFDGKLLYMTNTIDENDEFDVYLYKLNQELEYDSIYTQPFEYDYLCDHPIVEDTLDMENCTLWLDAGPIIRQERPELKVYPNPAKDFLVIRLPEYYSVSYQGELFKTTHTNYQYQKNAVLQIFNLNGQLMHEEKLQSAQTQSTLNVSNWQGGMYVVRLLVSGQRYGSVKFLVARN
ncbi:MAG: T9SS type A sorting domain-containing protein [Bacteroidales bacterium]|nr:T9SS type A sorting domain-containing protein [Bacteroidales bacterium]